MRKPYYSFVLVLGLLCSCSQQRMVAVRTGVLLPVPYQAQLAGELCWAASGEMVMDYWRTAMNDSNAEVFSQCYQARALYYVFNPGSSGIVCQGDSIPTEINVTSWPFQGWLLYDSCYRSSTDTSLLAWDTIVNQIDSSMPIVQLFNWAGEITSTSGKAGGHFVVVDGYQRTKYSNETFVSYDDPWGADCAVHKLVSYTEFTHPAWQAFLDSNGYRFRGQNGYIYHIKPLR